MRLRYNDYLNLSTRLAETHFLSQLVPGIIEKVLAVNAYLCKDPQILALLNSLYEYSPHTLEHLFHTQITACFLCIEGNLDQETTDYVLAGALLHDIGKLLVPSIILTKPGSLTASEWNIIKFHPIFSLQLLTPLGLPKPILSMVKYHHLCYNRTGYPDFDSCPLDWDSLNEKMIGFLSMADAFDAMYHRRSYRPPYHITKIHMEISSCLSKQFDPTPANILLKALSNISIREDVVIC